MANIDAIRHGDGEEYELRACAEPTYNLSDRQEAKIVAWRSECFEQAGLPLGLATILAMRRDVDREEVERLLQAGATPEQVLDVVT